MKYFIVDLDGTLALRHKGGVPHRGPFEFHKVYNDYPNQPVIEIVKSLITAGYRPIFVTGRDNSCYEDTIAWINERVITGGFFIFMREEGDFRPDDVVKQEIWETKISPSVSGGKNSILLVLDDRPKVIRMWASLGLPVIDVDPMSGEF